MRFSTVLCWLNETRKSTRRGRPAPGSSRRLKRPCRPSLEVLEDRAVPATFTVTNLNDAGAGSLRQAIADNNGTTADPDTIVFQPGLTGTITLTTGQLSVFRPVTITGPGSGALTISGNNASRIFLVDNGSIGVHTYAISGLTLTQGLATGILRGGGLQVTSEDLTLSDMVITGNKAERGGGIDVGPNGRLTLVSSTVSNNTATASNGGGLFLDANSLSFVRNCTISGNTTVGGGLSGAGIDLEPGGFLTIESTTISGNQTTFFGGGILCQPNTTLVVRNSTISGNTANDGAGIYFVDGSLTVENSTFSGNTAAREGGGLWMNGSVSVTIRNSTIAFNIADSDTAGGGNGGGIFIFDTVPASPALTLQSTIVAENLRGPGGPHSDINGTVVAASRNNLIGFATGLAGIFNGVNGNQVGSDTPLNPLLGPLQNNGGTMQTHALLAGSPALNVGFNFAGQASDQRGGPFARSVAATDIGAFEVQPALGPTPLPPPPLSPPTSPPPLPVVEIQVKRVKLRTRVDVRVNGALRQRFFPFGAFTGHVQVQRLDVNGDGLLDVIARAIINGKKRTRTFVT